MTQYRVLHFLWNGEIGGAERAVYQLVRLSVAIDKQAVGVAFGRAEGPYAEAIEALGCEVIDLRMRGGADLFPALRATNRLREFDIHHFHVLEPCEMLASMRCSDATRIFTQRHGTQQAPYPTSKRLRRAVAGKMLRRSFHAVSGNTQHATRSAVAQYGLEHLPHHVTYNGIDFSLLTSSPDRVDKPIEFKAAGTGMVVGSSGNFKSWKRLNRVVKLLGASPDIEVLLIGDGSLRGALEAQASALEARDRLHITGLVPNVADYLRSVDIFVLPSTADESFGNSVVEAMALGIPSIVFADSPGVCEHIEHGVTGFVAEDQGTLTSVVERLCADHSLRTRVGSAGADYVRSKYTLGNMREAYLRLYDAALSRRASG